MTRNTKIVVGIVIGILLICCAGAAIGATILPGMVEDFADNAFIEDSAEAKELASSIIDYTLPAGFEENGGMNILGVKTVYIGSSSDFGSAIILMQFPENTAGDEDAMQQQIQDNFALQSSNQNYEVEFVSTETKTINDETATFSFYEGVDDSGFEVRQVIGIFETNDGNIGMLMIIAPIAGWEETGYEKFLESLH